jgi:hypothetical protein
VDCVASDERQIVQSIGGIRNFVFERLSPLRLVLDCGSASIFERDDGGCKVRDMFLGPFNF